jgi:hypothetical protein
MRVEAQANGTGRVGAAAEAQPSPSSARDTLVDDLLQHRVPASAPLLSDAEIDETRIEYLKKGPMSGERLYKLSSAKTTMRYV